MNRLCEPAELAEQDRINTLGPTDPPLEVRVASPGVEVFGETPACAPRAGKPLPDLPCEGVVDIDPVGVRRLVQPATDSVTLLSHDERTRFLQFPSVSKLKNWRRDDTSSKRNACGG
jgi:hypothetical protein